jgi:serine/threonine protein kinase
MDLEAGTAPAHYTLLERIGAGGMGEVFRAADTKLARDVAIDRGSKDSKPEEIFSAASILHLGAISSAVSRPFPQILRTATPEERAHLTDQPSASGESGSISWTGCTLLEPLSDDGTLFV